MTEAYTPAKTQPWPGFKYEQVPGLANRHISRWLRYQRRNMLRFFIANNLVTLADRLQRIRKSNKGMMEKNIMFQGVLDDYARLASGSATIPGAEAGDTKDAPSAVLDVPAAGEPAAPVRGPGADDGSGVQGLEEPSERLPLTQDGFVISE